MQDKPRTQLIAHRKNTVHELKDTPTKYGIEMDLRSWKDELIVTHDPFINGELFSTWIESYRHKTLILNVKAEGFEDRLLEIMKSKGITDYFFLDQSLPFLVKYANLGVHKCAVRLSEYESIETVLNFAGKVDWVWVDCFTKFPLSAGDAQRLKKAGFKLCLVSPELQKRDPAIEIPQLANLLRERDIFAEAICTKRPDLWEKEIPCS
jgi:hypothetical protein